MKQAVERSARILNYLGLVLIVVGVMFTIVAVVLRFSNISESQSYYYWIAHVKFTLLGCVVLAMGSFVRYSFDNDYRQSWMLCHIDLFLYLYAALIMIHKLSVFSTILGRLWTRADVLVLITTFLFFMIPAIAIVFLLLGIAKVTKITLSIISESRTLV